MNVLIGAQAAVLLIASLLLLVAVQLLISRQRRRVLRAALASGDERVRTLTITEIQNLRGALTDYLATADGAAIAEHPNVTTRLALFDELLDMDRRRRALTYAGLTSKEQEASR